MADIPNYRIFIPLRRWTPMRQEVFAEVLPSLEGKQSALIYLELYDRLYHRSSNSLKATVADISDWTRLDERTVSKCLRELEAKGFVKRVGHGVLRSRVLKPAWKVPLAAFDLRDGGWTPVPRFLITKYCREFHNAVLLVVLLRYQHLRWVNHCWPGVPTLSKVTGWSETRIRNALRIMGHELEWRMQETSLPRPLEITWHGTGENARRHFSSRAIHYERQKRGYSIMVVTAEFAKRFKIPYSVGFETEGRERPSR